MSASTATTDHSHDPEFVVTVEYRPSHDLTPAQVGEEVARIQRRIKKITDGSTDE